jgi:hypothetical protein
MKKKPAASKRRSNNVWHHMGELEKELGLPEGWHNALVKESDWSFIIKTHALIESGLTHAIESHLKRKDLSGFIASLGIDGRTSKLALASVLVLIDKDDAELVRALSALRNACVHDVRSVGFTFADFWNDGKRDHARLLRALDPFTRGGNFADLGGTPEAYIRKYPKFALQTAVAIVLASLYHRRELAQRIADAQYLTGVYVDDDYVEDKS